MLKKVHLRKTNPGSKAEISSRRSEKETTEPELESCQSEILAGIPKKDLMQIYGWDSDRNPEISRKPRVSTNEPSIGTQYYMPFIRQKHPLVDMPFAEENNTIFEEHI